MEKEKYSSGVLGWGGELHIYSVIKRSFVLQDGNVRPIQYHIPWLVFLLYYVVRDVLITWKGGKHFLLVDRHCSGLQFDFI